MLPDFEAWLRLFGRWLRDYQVQNPKPLMTEERWIEGKERILESRLSLIADRDIRFNRPGCI